MESRSKNEGEGGRGRGWLIHSRFILVPQKILNRTSQFLTWCFTNIQQMYSRTGTRYIFFYISMFVVSVIIGVKVFHVVYLHFEFRFKIIILTLVRTSRSSFFFLRFVSKTLKKSVFRKCVLLQNVFLKIVVCKASSS